MAVNLLQWGRSVNAAETHAGVRVRVRARCSFNGAAALTLRKLAKVTDAVLAAGELQWGRSVNAAETRLDGVGPRVYGGASMGPQR